MALGRGAKSRIPLRPADFVRDSVSLPQAPRQPGSLALDLSCDMHGGRLMRLWMSPRAGDATFGGEGAKGAWDSDPSGCGAVLVTCVRPGCHNSARLTNEWLTASFGQVQADFEAGRGLPIAWFPLSQVGLTPS
jgi:hypothetical protein